MKIACRLIIAAGLAVPGQAWAQSREPFTSEYDEALFRRDVAGSRQPEGSDAIGVRVSGVLIQPTGVVRTGVNSNVLQRSINGKADAYVVIEPAVTASFDTGVSSAVLRAEAAAARFLSTSSQNSETFGIGASASRRLDDRAGVNARLSFERRVERRGDPGDSDVEGSPAEFDQVVAQISGQTQLGGIRLSSSLRAERRTYADIEAKVLGSVDQSFRNTRTLAVTAKAEYALTSGPTLFVEGRASDIASLNARVFADRSSTGFQILGGIHAPIGELIEARIALGYVNRDYLSAGFKDFSGLVWDGKIDWYPSPLLSLSIAASRRIASSGIRSAAGVVVDSVGLDAYYEIATNLNLHATGSYARERYRETAARATAKRLGMGASYVVSPALRGGIDLGWLDRASDSGLTVRDASTVEGSLWLKVAM